MMANIAELLAERNQIKDRLSKMIYGSVEFRERGGKKYIYVHYREDGNLLSKYAGEFSNELYNLILENSSLAKELKKRLRGINKALSLLSYKEEELDPKVELNIDFASKNLVSSIYKQSALEGVATTYSDTETLVEGGKVSDMTAEDVTKVVNLKHAWEFILSKGVVEYPTNYQLLCQINSIVEEGFSYTAGSLRSVPVSISGCHYIPPIPFESQVKEEIASLFGSKKEPVSIAIDLLLYVMRKQIFLDGNKRTAVIFANHFLIRQGLGLIVIPAERVEEYKKLLVAFYETDDKEEISAFLKDKCLMAL